jgi:hypothetical protein
MTLLQTPSLIEDVDRLVRFNVEIREDLQTFTVVASQTSFLGIPIPGLHVCGKRGSREEQRQQARV